MTPDRLRALLGDAAPGRLRRPSRAATSWLIPMPDPAAAARLAVTLRGNPQVGHVRVEGTRVVVLELTAPAALEVIDELSAGRLVPSRLGLASGANAWGVPAGRPAWGSVALAADRARRHVDSGAAPNPRQAGELRLELAAALTEHLDLDARLDAPAAASSNAVNRGTANPKAVNRGTDPSRRARLFEDSLIVVASTYTRMWESHPADRTGSSALDDAVGLVLSAGLERLGCPPPGRI